MGHLAIIRASQEEASRLSVSEAPRAPRPENPGGLLARTEAPLGAVAEGTPIALSSQGRGSTCNDHGYTGLSSGWRSRLWGPRQVLTHKAPTPFMPV